jgi:hypothetical protein
MQVATTANAAWARRPRARCGLRRQLGRGTGGMRQLSTVETESLVGMARSDLAWSEWRAATWHGRHIGRVASASRGCPSTSARSARAWLCIVRRRALVLGAFELAGWTAAR